MTNSPQKPKKLLDQYREAIRLKQYSLRTPMIYTHVLQRGGLAVRSPLDDRPSTAFRFSNH